MTTEISDPLEPPKFKHKRIPLGAPPAPPPVMQSPPRKLTNEDQLNWKVPPCVSNWKNAKGYIIPLHIRIQADGRNMQDTTINPKFAKITEALYASERHARTEIEERNKIQQSLTMREALIKEEALRNRATKARAQKYVFIYIGGNTISGNFSCLLPYIYIYYIYKYIPWFP